MIVLDARFSACLMRMSRYSTVSYSSWTAQSACTSVVIWERVRGGEVEEGDGGEAGEEGGDAGEEEGVGVDSHNSSLQSLTIAWYRCGRGMWTE